MNIPTLEFRNQLMDHRMVQVNHWKYDREVMVFPGHVALQVTVPGCSHCPTCQRRVAEFADTLARKGTVIHQWKTLADGAHWLFLPRGEGMSPLRLLGEVLEIRITESG